MKGHLSFPTCVIRGNAHIPFTDVEGQCSVTCKGSNSKGRFWRCRGLNPGPFTCKANALPLSYIPLCIFT